MPDYLLTCECGEGHRVSTARAGESLRCACGRVVPVPTMRGLRELPVAGETAAPRRAWGDRERVGFLFALGSLTCLLVAGYLWAGMPELPLVPSDAELAELVETSGPIELWNIHNQIDQGLTPMPHEFAAVRAVRRSMSWGIGVVLVMALLAAICACVVVWKSPPARR